MQLSDFLSSQYGKIHIPDLKQLKNAVLFVTGANGLIGGNILSYLSYRNHIDRLNLKIFAHSFSPKKSWLPDSEDITYLHSDLIDFKPDFAFDYLINTATYATPKKFLANRLATIKINTVAVLHLLEAASRNNAKILHLSSSEVYGHNTDNKDLCAEDYNGDVSVFSPRACYAESKRLSETIAGIYRENGLDVKIARIAIGYGCGVDLNDARFINEFIRKAIRNGEIRMLDKGAAKRQLCFITDIVEMLLNILLSGKEFVYNVGSQSILTVLDVANIIGKLANVPVILPEEEKSVGGKAKDLSLDISRYVNEFKKAQFLDPETGIGLNMQWLKMLEDKKGQS